MNKADIINQLIDLIQGELDLIQKTEKQGIKEATENQEEDNRLENTKEEEINKLAQNNIAIEDLSKRLTLLKEINTNIVHEKVAFGALVKLNTGCLLVGSPFPTVKIGEEKVTGISKESPLYQKMEGFKKGAEFHLTEHPTEYIILDIQ